MKQIYALHAVETLKMSLLPFEQFNMHFKQSNIETENHYAGIRPYDFYAIGVHVNGGSMFRSHSFVITKTSI